MACGAIVRMLHRPSQSRSALQIAARYDLIAPMYANFSDDVRGPSGAIDAKIASASQARPLRTALQQSGASVCLFVALCSVTGSSLSGRGCG